MADEQADWIVIDLSIAIVHIFSPAARRSYDLDGRLASESISESGAEGPRPSGESLEDDRAVLMELARSLPRKVARHPMQSTDESAASTRSRRAAEEDIEMAVPMSRGRGGPEGAGGEEHNPFLH